MPGWPWVIVVLVGWAVFLPGCGTDPAFHRPNLLVPFPDGKSVAIVDFRANRILITDRNFRLQREDHPPRFQQRLGGGGESG